MFWIKISLRTIVEEMKINKSTKYPNSRNQCFHGAGDISEKGGGEVDREICRFLKSNQMVGATQSFVSKRFFDECLSPALLVQTFEFCMNCFCSWDYRGTSEGNWPQTQVVLKILSAYFQAAKIWQRHIQGAEMAMNRMFSLVFLLVGSFSQRVKIPDLPTCEGLQLFSLQDKSSLFPLASTWTERELFFPFET